jgi:hypothetical protein
VLYSAQHIMVLVRCRPCAEQLGASQSQRSIRKPKSKGVQSTRYVFKPLAFVSNADPATTTRTLLWGRMNGSEEVSLKRGDAVLFWQTRDTRLENVQLHTSCWIPQTSTLLLSKSEHRRSRKPFTAGTLQRLSITRMSSSAILKASGGLANCPSPCTLAA